MCGTRELDIVDTRQQQVVQEWVPCMSGLLHKHIVFSLLVHEDKCKIGNDIQLLAKTVRTEGRDRQSIQWDMSRKCQYFLSLKITEMLLFSQVS